MVWQIFPYFAFSVFLVLIHCYYKGAVSFQMFLNIAKAENGGVFTYCEMVYYFLKRNMFHNAIEEPLNSPIKTSKETFCFTKGSLWEKLLKII